MKCFSKAVSLISGKKKVSFTQGLAIIQMPANFLLGLSDGRNGVH